MVGRILKIIRKKKGLKQSELSRLLNIAQTTLSGYETSYSNPKFATIEQFANLCDYEIVFRNKHDGTELTTEIINNNGK